MIIEILYQDEDLIIVNKPANLLVHPYKEAKQDKTSLLKELKNQTGLYLYPVHRLDRPVSGVIVFALNPQSVRKLQEKWHTNEVKKSYLALVRSQFKSPGEITFELGDKNKVKKPAHTKYTPLELYSYATLMKVEIFTGRFHQIRRHFARTVQHVLGDRTYGKKKYNDHYLQEYGLERIFLHSHSIEFPHPTTNKTININCPLTQDLHSVLVKLNKEHRETLQENRVISYE